METKLSKLCDGIIEAGWLAAIVATPLFFNIHSSRVFEPDKLTLLRSIALLMTAAWLVKFVNEKGWRSYTWLGLKRDHSIWRMPFILPVTLLVIVYLISSIFSVTPAVSWAGSYQRLQGTYTTISYIIIFALMLLTIRRREQITRLVTAAIVTSIPISLYGMLQHFDWDPLPWGGNVVSRIAGNMGNSIFISAYLIMVLPLTAARIVDAFTNILQDEEIDSADVIRSAIYVFALAIQVIAIWWSRSRGPLLGLLASAFTFILILLVTLRNTRLQRTSLADVGRAVLLVAGGTLIPFFIAVFLLRGRASDFATFAFFLGMLILVALVIVILALGRSSWSWLWLSWLVLAGMGAIFLGLFQVSPATAEPIAETAIIGDTLDTMQSWRDLEEIGRYGTILDRSSGTASVRTLIWEGVLDLIAPHEPLEKPNGEEDPFNFLRPIFGYGPESMYVAYNRFYPPELATVEARNASPDRSHNETFDALVITGGAGLLAWELLYLAVFYYGFKWLGVVKSNRDRYVLIALFIFGAVGGGLLVTRILGDEFLGVAIPAGTIVGLVAYLVYYAAVSRPTEVDESVNPFGVDRLLMIALVSAVMAHYVEISFGIAIAATRTYFFVSIALMFLVGYYLPRLKLETAISSKGQSKGKRRRASSTIAVSSGWSMPVFVSALVMALIIGILAYDYSTIPAGVNLDGVPTAGDIFHLSFFVNPQRDFIEVPYIYLLLFMTWSLGSLAFISELMKRGVIAPGNVTNALLPNRQRLAAISYTIFAILSLVFAVVSKIRVDPAEESLTQRMAFWLLLFWGICCVWAAQQLFMNRSPARTLGGIFAFIALCVSLPLMVAGPVLTGIGFAAISIYILYLLWDNSWNSYLVPAAVLAISSFAIGLVYAFIHTNQIIGGITTPATVTSETPATVQRVLEANQSYGVLNLFYFFAFFMVLTLGFVLAWPGMGSMKKWGSVPALVLALALIPAVVIAIDSSNLRIIQADIVYKRADPWDKQAGKDGDPALWANAIAIYERAIDLAPFEDFYYLWLGRAYLERSNVIDDVDARKAMLETAEDRLLEAQRINPLNTDHTANLARLNTRWAESVSEEERPVHVQKSAEYYEKALSLSPNNAVIINEYARLAYLLQHDCEKSMNLYDHSVETDPFYTTTFFDRAEVAGACAAQAPAGERAAAYSQAAERLQDALAKNPRDVRDWVRLIEYQIRANQFEEALAAYTETQERVEDEFALWELDFQVARWFQEEGQLTMALDYAQRALEGAPEQSRPPIQQLVAELSGSAE